MRNYFMYENKRRNKFVIEYPKLIATDRHCSNCVFSKNSKAWIVKTLILQMYVKGPKG